MSQLEDVESTLNSVFLHEDRLMKFLEYKFGLNIFYKLDIAAYRVETKSSKDYTGIYYDIYLKWEFNDNDTRLLKLHVSYYTSNNKDSLLGNEGYVTLKIVGTDDQLIDNEKFTLKDLEVVENA